MILLHQLEKYLVIFSLLILVDEAHAQTNAEKTSHAIGFMFSPGYSYRKTWGTDSQSKAIATQLNKTEESASRYDIGISYKRSLSKYWHFFIESNLSQRGYSDRNDSFDHRVQFVVRDFKMYRFYFLDFPLKVAWCFAEKDSTVRFSLITGINNSFFNRLNLSESTNSISSDPFHGRIIYTHGYRLYQVGLIGGFEIAILPSEHIAINLRPQIKYMFSNSSPITNPSLKQNHYTIGVGVGLDYTF